MPDMVPPDTPEESSVPSDDLPSDDGDFVPPEPEELNALFQDYHIEHLIAQGGMGAVYRGIQTKLDRPIAIKILPRHFGADKGYAERFELEAKAMARLTHTNIVSVFDYGESSDGRFLYFIMEFVEGSNLHERILQGPVSEEEAITILRQAAGALQYAHENGVIHRDIKPANLLLDQSGQVKIADFGLAKVPAGDVDDTVFGTPEYIAPEALVEGFQIDHRSDIFSLGVLAYELLIGEPPRGEFDLPSSLRSDLDRRLDDIILNTITQDPNERYARASDVDDALYAIQSTPKLIRSTPTAKASPRMPVTSGKTALPRPTRSMIPQKKKNAGPIIALVFALCLLAAGALYYLNKSGEPNTPLANQDNEKIPDELPAPNPKPDPTNTTEVSAPAALMPGPDLVPSEPEPDATPSPDYTEPPVINPEWDAIRSQGGRLRAYGVADKGLPISLERAGDFDDFIKLDARATGTWLALRRNGDLVSPNANEQDFTEVRSFHAVGPWALIVKGDGTVWKNQFDQIAADEITEATKAGAGNRHGAVLNSDGSVFVFGNRHEGSDIVSLPPIPLTDIVDIAVGVDCVAVVDTNGNVHLWNEDFDLVTLEGEDVVEIEAGLHHFVARTRLGKVLEWVGTDPLKTRPEPIPADLGQVIAVRAGGGTSAAQRPDGTWTAWGREGFNIPDTINNLGPAIDIAFHCANNSRGFVFWIEPLESAQPIDTSRVGDRLVTITGEFRNRYQHEYLAVRNGAIDKLNLQLIGAFERSLGLVSPTSEIAGEIQMELDRINNLIEKNSQAYSSSPNLFVRPNPPDWMPDRMREYRETYREEFTKSLDSFEDINLSLFDEYLTALNVLEQEIIESDDRQEMERIRAFIERLQEEGPAVLSGP
ncbi:MAG: protein kinase [Verrucomicrobiota bacterium]